MIRIVRDGLSFSCCLFSFLFYFDLVFIFLFLELKVRVSDGHKSWDTEKNEEYSGRMILYNVHNVCWP